MDELQRLKIEFHGIESAIIRHASGNIRNILNQLEIALDKNDMESIKYCLKEIYLWYKLNIDSIHNSGYRSNIIDNDRNRQLIDDFIISMESYKLEPKMKTKNEVVYNEPLIFLSHNSKDILYGNALRDLLVGLGLKNLQLVYTSHPLHKIPLDRNIYNYLREAIDGNVFVIILWSNSYLESPACLNEMGAAWIVQSDYTNIYTPDFEFGNPKYHECAIDTRKMGAILKADDYCKASITELKDKVTKLFKLKIDEKAWIYTLDKFISDIKNKK